MKLTLLHKGLLLVSIPLCFEITIFGILLHMQDQIETEAVRVNKNKQISDNVSGIVHQLVKVSDSFDIRMAHDTDSTFKHVLMIKEELRSCAEKLRYIRELAKDDPVLAAKVDRCFQGIVKGKADLIELGRKVQEFNGADDQQKVVTDYRHRLSADIHESLGMGLLELGEYTSRETEDLASSRLRERIRLILKIALGVSVAFALFCAALFSKQLVGRLQLVAANADRLAKGEALLEPIGGTDEVAELDEHLHYAAKLIEEAKRLRQEVTAMITHDLKTPLQSVRSYLEMLETGLFGELNERGKKLLATTESASEHMSELIDSVLQLEKARTGKIPLNESLVELAPLLEKSLASVKAFAEGKEISLITEFTTADCDVSADEFWLQEVFVNILSNAIKYSPGNTKVTVRTSVDSRKNVDIAFIDEGPGIAKEEINLIFERFHRIKATENIAGTGLGLPIAKQLIELHRGTIKVESDGIKGTTFIITLPIWRPV
ncbi:MAG TPA: HAMP domain-containing sensor histidine kinase [Drouetiella sp.]